MLLAWVTTRQRSFTVDVTSIYVCLVIVHCRGPPYPVHDGPIVRFLLLLLVWLVLWLVERSSTT